MDAAAPGRRSAAGSPTRPGAATLVVTAAGRARRLEPVSSVIPKPFLPIAITADGSLESPLVRLVRQFSAVGVRRVLVAATDHPWFATLHLDGVSLETVLAPPDGEWSAVETCLGATSVAGPTFVASGDNVFSARDVEEFVLADGRPEVSRVAVSPRASTSGLTRVEAVAGRVRRLDEKPPDAGGGLAKAGLYAFGTQALSVALGLPPRRDRFGERSMTEILAGLLDAGTVVACHQLRHPFQDVGTVPGLRDAVLGRDGARGSGSPG